MEDILHKVFILLEIENFVSCMRVNKSWNKLCNSKGMWIYLTYRDHQMQFKNDNEAYNTYRMIYTFFNVLDKYSDKSMTIFD